ncbi:hypothetical protein Syun_011962 [Stephania yunnanensis]|uniref:Uncharacterized protein n=1 Tax=Stephania yunnanensis TaxID=152371 RepID=A0AAP0K104_9MAGN
MPEKTVECTIVGIMPALIACLVLLPLVTSIGYILSQAQARKEALRKIPEQAILAEVCRIIEEMHTLNRKLDKTERLFVTFSTINLSIQIHEAPTLQPPQLLLRELPRSKDFTREATRQSRCEESLIRESLWIIRISLTYSL